MLDVLDALRTSSVSKPDLCAVLSRIPYLCEFGFLVATEKPSKYDPKSESQWGWGDCVQCDPETREAGWHHQHASHS